MFSNPEYIYICYIFVSAIIVSSIRLYPISVKYKLAIEIIFIFMVILNIITDFIILFTLVVSD